MKYMTCVGLLLVSSSVAATEVPKQFTLNLDATIKNELGVPLKDGSKASKEDPDCSKGTCGDLTVGRVIIQAFLSEEPRPTSPVTIEEKWHRGVLALSLAGKHSIALTLEDAATLRSLMKAWPPIVVAQIMPLIDPNNTSH